MRKCEGEGKEVVVEEEEEVVDEGIVVFDEGSDRTPLEVIESSSDHTDGDASFSYMYACRQETDGNISFLHSLPSQARSQGGGSRGSIEPPKFRPRK